MLKNTNAVKPDLRSQLLNEQLLDSAETRLRLPIYRWGNNPFKKLREFELGYFVELLAEPFRVRFQDNTGETNTLPIKQVDYDQLRWDDASIGDRLIKRDYSVRNSQYQVRYLTVKTSTNTIH